MNQDALTQLLTRLQAAQSDEEREWLVMQFSLDNMAPAVREAVWAAAIPHWFDADFLAALLDERGERAQELYQALQEFSFVEVFPGRGYNLHERSRALLLGRLWQDDQARYRELSQRAAAHCAGQDQTDTGWRVEMVYHLLVAEPDRGARQLQNTGWEWHNPPNFAYDKVEALARLAREHADAGRLAERGLGWTLFWEAMLDLDYSRYRPARDKFLRIQITSQIDPYLAADRALRLGDVHRVLAEYEAARGRYEEARPIYRDIGSRMGEVNCLLGLADLDRQNEQWAAAEQKCRQALAYYQATGMTFNVALALWRLGHTAKGAGNPTQARDHYETALTLFTQIGSPQAEKVQADIDGLEEG